MFIDALRNFPKQFEFEPEVKNKKALKTKKKFVVCGMGGSQLAADLLRCAYPGLDLVGWRDYGLPPLKDIQERLIILSSYSGNTEETLSAFKLALKEGLPVAVIAKGGELIKLAIKNEVPYVAIPDTGIQPRMATGFMLRGLMALMGDKEGLLETFKLAKSLRPEKLEEEGKKLSLGLAGRVPVIYASAQNEALARNWKIKFNENGKIPAFYNVLPEMNHNEMTGFDMTAGTRPVAANFSFVFLKDKKDDPRTKKRMEVLEKLLENRDLKVFGVDLSGSGYEKIFNAHILGDWTSYHTALHYGSEPEAVPMVEEFKKLIKK